MSYLRHRARALDRQCRDLPPVGPGSLHICGHRHQLVSSQPPQPPHNFVFRTFNLIIAMTFLTLTDILTRAGAFFLYGGLAALGTTVFYLFLPETRGRSLEEMTLLFSGPLRVDRK